LFFNTSLSFFSVGDCEVELYMRADFDLKNGIDGKVSRLLRGNSVCVGAFPPSLTADAGIESITQFILLGPLQQAKQHGSHALNTRKQFWFC
jgi:hypothetical protein